MASTDRKSLQYAKTLFFQMILILNVVWMIPSLLLTSSSSNPRFFGIVTSTSITTGTTSSAFHFRIYFLVHWQSKINILAFFLFFFILPDRVLLTGLNDLIEYHKVYVCLILFEFWFFSVDLPFVCIFKNTNADPHPLNHIWSFIFFQV